jgi:hypothetical protein
LEPLAPSPAWTLVTPYCKHTRPGRETNTKAAIFPPLSHRSPAASLSPLRARPRARPIWAGARGDIHSSAQGPPGLETPTISAKDAAIKELRASKKSIAQELETAQLVVKVAEETSITLRAQRDRAMDKAIHAGRILMRRPGVVVPDDIRADVNAAPDSSSRPSSSVAPEKDIAK